ncbi:MAG: DNA adenine methylase [Lachnospiraceae bacterium]|nr:DNA adenine methylase [Lachnospiraceae bacterium]
MEFIKSPLNYTGGKYKILAPLFEIFPEHVRIFVDLFAGGFNVGINANADKIICNDQIHYLLDLYRTFQGMPTNELINEINERIDYFDLSLTNAEGYHALRERYNDSKNSIDFFVLTCYSFNHQIRFNNSQKFNTPFGKERSSYNASIENNLIRFCEALRTKNVEFHNQDFLDLDLSKLTSDDFVYCDPPYLISTGSYNDGKRGFKDWTLTEERQLLGLLDELHAGNIKFALSNVLYHKGMSNDLLIEWSRNYHVYYIDKRYSNCSYQFKDRNTKTVEVVITNFESGGYVQWQQQSLF